MAKEPHQKTNAELAQDLSTRPDSLVHLTARAEMARRAAVQDQWRSWIMLASVVIAAPLPLIAWGAVAIANSPSILSMFATCPASSLLADIGHGA